MPELPEVYNIARQMNDVLAGRSIVAVEVLQEKCLNMPVEDFRATVVGKPTERVSARGKWIFTELRGGSYLLISLGMGGEVIYHAAGDEVQSRHQFRFTFDDGCSVHVFFSWFGYVHAADEHSIREHKMTASLGICPLDDGFSYERFAGMLAGKKGGIKAYLMDQHNIAGIGNVYIQDILFKAGLHPNHKISDLSEAETRGLYEAIRGHLRHAVELGGLVYESDFYGRNGRYTYQLVGHKPGAPCPRCGTIIREIRTGSTRSYICERCQR